VEDSEEEEVVAEAAAAPPEVLPDAHQVVRRADPDPGVLLLPAVHVVRVCQVVLGLGVPFHPVMGLLGRRQLSRSLGPLG
jgi:hypothetical protein